VRHFRVKRLPPSARWGALLATVLAVGYGLHIRPLRPEYVVVSGELFSTYNEEVMAVAAQYMSPLFFWLGALGLVLALWQRRVPHEQALLALFVVSFGTPFFWKYTTAMTYPVALRRLVPEVLPGLSLFGAFALRWLSRRPRWRWTAAAVAGLVTVLLLSVSGLYWFHQGAAGTWGFLDALAGRLPADAVVLFEPRGEGSIVGWFAAPLWSFFQRDALLLNKGEIDEGALQDAIRFWQRQGRDVYVVSQHDPSNWWPSEFRGRLESEISWASRIIGQSRRFPPVVWRFAFTFSIYRWEGNLCS
jgi:hypothetical protein